MQVEFVEARVDAGDGAQLIRAMAAEIEVLYGGLDLDGPDMPAAGPAELGPPFGLFLVGYADSEPVCCGGFKRLTADACEIKRMFVVREARRHGLARVLLGELEHRAALAGYSIARLGTGPRQAHAQRLYEDAGYHPIGNFSANPVATYFGEKTISAKPAAQTRSRGSLSG